MGQEVFHGGEDLRDPRLVVRPQEGGAVGDHQVLPHLAGQVGEVFQGGDDPLLLVEHQVAPFVADHPGLDVLTGDPGGGVHMGDEGQHRDLFPPRRGGEPGVHRPVLRQVGPLQPQVLEFLGQGLPQQALLGGGGGGLRGLGRLGVIGYIAQEALQRGHGSTSSHALARSRARFHWRYSRPRRVWGV